MDTSNTQSTLQTFSIPTIDWPEMTRSAEVLNKKGTVMRKIIDSGLADAVWMPGTDSMRSGDEIGFDIDSVKVRAIVTIQEHIIKVQMTSPAETTTHRLYPTNLSMRNAYNAAAKAAVKPGNDNRPVATKECVKAAKEILVWMYEDWVILNLRRDVIRQKLEQLPAFEAWLAKEEQKRIAPLKEEINYLNEESWQLKSCFKNGEMTQREYLNLRAPIHARMIVLQKEAEPKDAFKVLFDDELSDCWHIDGRKQFIETVGMGKSAD